MLAIERRNDILSIMQESQSVLVSELSKRYNVTEETIRRDLEKLENDGLVKKTYGGAVLRENINTDIPLKVRQRSNRPEKMIIAEKVAGLVEDGDTVSIDSSSTGFFIAKLLKNKRKLTVITNSVEILLEFSQCGNIKVISTGGELRDSSLSLIGRSAERAASAYNSDMAILSCKGLDMSKGVTDSNEYEAEVKKAFACSAKKIIIAADSSKFDKVSFVSFLSVAGVNTLVSDSYSEKWASFLTENSVKFM